MSGSLWGALLLACSLSYPSRHCTRGGLDSASDFARAHRVAHNARSSAPFAAHASRQAEHVCQRALTAAHAPSLSPDRAHPRQHRVKRSSADLVRPPASASVEPRRAPAGSTSRGDLGTRASVTMGQSGSALLQEMEKSSNCECIFGLACAGRRCASAVSAVLRRLSADAAQSRPRRSTGSGNAS